MGYVKPLLYGKLDLHRKYLNICKTHGDLDDVLATREVIDEIEIALEILNSNDTYQKY